MTLKNEGEDAYKPETYGNSIVFHRTIWESGQSSVIIKNFNNEAVIKNKNAREEGKRILENFRINTDNPIAILQQEEAKELLKVESPGGHILFSIDSLFIINNFRCFVPVLYEVNTPQAVYRPVHLCQH